MSGGTQVVEHSFPTELGTQPEQRVLPRVGLGRVLHLGQRTHFDLRISPRSCDHLVQQNLRVQHPLMSGCTGELTLRVYALSVWTVNLNAVNQNAVNQNAVNLDGVGSAGLRPAPARQGDAVEQRLFRIDELAQESGLTVDTIRYYASKRLIEPPERSGRHKLYDRGHLDRLRRIRELKDQQFSLAAIRAIVCADRPGLEGLFAGAGRTYSYDDLVARAGVDRDLVDSLHDVGLLPDPAEFGREAYDESDLGLLRAVAELQAIGMTPQIILGLGAIYVRHFRALQRDVHDMLAGKDRDWDQDELVAIQGRLTANSQRMIPAVDQVLNYIHQRTVQRLTLEAMATAEATGTGVGGVRVPTQ